MINMIKKTIIVVVCVLAIGGLGYYYNTRPDDFKNLWTRGVVFAGNYYNKIRGKTPSATENNAIPQIPAPAMAQGNMAMSDKQPAASGDAPAQISPPPPVMAMDNTVTLDAKARQLAGLQTERVAVKTLNKPIRMTGKIAMNENGRSYITSRVEGRIDKLYITAEGEYIAPGKAIASVAYNPSYIAAQEEYILTLESAEKLKNAGKDVVEINDRLREAAKRKLKLLNVSDRDISNLEKNRKPAEHMTIYAQFGGTVLEREVLAGAYIKQGDKLFGLANLSTVWLYVDVYEKDLGGIRIGQTVAVTSEAYPGENFSGKVTFISPLMDDATRTVKVRVEMPNPKGKLKPNMFMNARIENPLPARMAVLESSILDTGEKSVVFVARGENTFAQREVVTGQSAEGYVQILSGLQPGDTVVTAATFLLDSQTRLGSFGSHGGHSGAAATPATGGHSGNTPAEGGHAGGSGPTNSPATGNH
jgi:Cu(I)/Ag(I) efflux system membrane fusion protein